MTRMQGRGWPRLSESPLETKGLGAGQEEEPLSTRGWEVEPFPFALTPDSPWLELLPGGQEWGPWCPFWRREREAEPGMEGSRLRGRKVQPLQIGTSSATLFSISFGSLSPDTEA